MDRDGLLNSSPKVSQTWRHFFLPSALIKSTQSISKHVFQLHHFLRTQFWQWDDWANKQPHFHSSDYIKSHNATHSQLQSAMP